MTRDQIEHLIRAGGEIVQDDLVVVGSQAILGTHPDAPAPMLLSVEADVYPITHPSRSDEIDGAIGENTRFHRTFGIYAHGVGPETVVGPAGWEARLVCLVAESVLTSQRPHTGWCLEAHDLMLAKLAAGRDKDLTFVEEALRAGLVDRATLEERAATVPESHRDFARSNLRAAIARSRV